MVREALAPLQGQKSLWFCTFEKFGWKRFRGRYVGKTLLFVNVRDKDGKVVTEHLWFRMSKGFEKLDLKKGDEVAFHARVDTYVKGYRRRNADGFREGGVEDYHLEYPEGLVKLNDAAQAKIC